MLKIAGVKIRTAISIWEDFSSWSFSSFPWSLYNVSQGWPFLLFQREQLRWSLAGQWVQGWGRRFTGNVLPSYKVQVHSVGSSPARRLYRLCEVYSTEDTLYKCMNRFRWHDIFNKMGLNSSSGGVSPSQVLPLPTSFKFVIVLLTAAALSLCADKREELSWKG